MQDKLINIIKDAGVILKEGYYSVKEPSFKGKKDLVTKYDVAVEEYLKEKFSQVFSDFNIIAEESDNSMIEFNNSIIIDPIDGTTNFVNGVPHCAISVGVFKDKKPYIGVVYNPILDELYSAKVGEGAYLNGNRLCVSNDKKLEVALISTGFPYTSASDSKALEFVIKNMQTVLPLCQDIRRLGSASIDLCMVARGTYAGYYEINLKAWDVSAGIIILTESGGKVSNIMGEEYDIFGNDCIVATNGYIHTELLSHLKDI
jgi:myo-inositol-1(or 4)-monophosphatase